MKAHGNEGLPERQPYTDDPVVSHVGSLMGHYGVRNLLDHQKVIVQTAEIDKGTGRGHEVLLSIRQRVDVAIQAPS